MDTILKMSNITKNFAGVVANKDVSLELHKGEIHGLIGENGAGKTTLMNILYGLHQPDSGTIEIDGKKVEIKGPDQAIENRIGMVHQHFMLVPTFTVLQNIILGREPNTAGYVRLKEAKARVQEVIDKYSLKIDLNAKVSHLSVGQMQVVEIAKLLYRNARIIILDEPTAVLPPAEIQELFKTLKSLTEKGCSIIFITHKMKEVIQITDRITIMRKGVVTGNVRTADTTEDELSLLMIGKKLPSMVDRKEISSMMPVFEAENVRAADDRGLPMLKGVSFNVNKGEILGVAGVEGNGQEELVEAIVGLRPVESGSLKLNGKNIENLKVRDRRSAGLANIPSDRLKTGVAVQCSVEDNLLTTRYFKAPFSNRYGILNLSKMKEYAEGLIEKYLIKVPSSDYRVATLSGGNMQKVIVARELEANPDFLVASQPTRGVDIGAISFIYDSLICLRNDNKGILLVSAELDEILKLSDRIIVLYEGKIAAEFKNDGSVSEAEIGLYMTGGKKQEMY